MSRRKSFLFYNQDFFEKAPTSILRLKEDFSIKDIDNAFLMLTGFNQKQIIGKNLCEFINETSWKEELLEKKQVYNYSAQIKTITDEYQKVTCSFAGFFDGGGTLLEVVAWIQLKDYFLQGLEDKQQKYNHLLQALPDIIFTIDPEGRFTFVNEAVKLLGYSAEELIGEHFSKIIHPEDIGNISRRDVLPKFKDKITGDDDAPKIFDERRGFKRRTKNLVIRLVKNPSAECNKRVFGSVVTWGEISSAGHYLPLHNLKQTQTQVSDSFLGTVGIIRDISDRRQQEQVLRKLYIATEQSPVSIIITNKKGIIEYVNPKFIEVSGFAQEEVIGENARILKSGIHEEGFYEKIWETIQNGAEWKGEIKNRKKNGILFWEFVSISPIRSPEGEITHYVGIQEDITRSKEIEAELIEAKEAAESANKAKSLFLANMSHEIRTPLNAILGFSQFLYKKETDRDKKEQLEIILKSGESLMHVINDILDFSKIEAERMELIESVFSVKDLLMDIYHIFSLKARQKTIKFKIFFDSGLPDFLIGDEKHLKQILVNIVGNAVKFTEDGFVSLRAAYDGKILLIKIQDSGPGIPLERQAAVFNVFEQVHHEGKNRHVGGTGLGLAISERLAEMMGGIITIEASSPNTGSTFAIRVPMSETEKDNLEEVSDLEKDYIVLALERWTHLGLDQEDIKELLLGGLLRLASELPILYQKIKEENYVVLKEKLHSLKGMIGNLKLQEFYEILQQMDLWAKEKDSMGRIYKACEQLDTMLSGVSFDRLKSEGDLEKETVVKESKYKILAAEDNQVNQDLLKTFLKDLGYQYKIVANGEDALEAIEQEEFDLLLLDMQMPKMDGVETLEALAKKKYLSRIYIIALTANAVKKDLDFYLKKGCDEYIVKPIDYEVFRYKIAQALRLGKPKK